MTEPAPSTPLQDLSAALAQAIATMAPALVSVRSGRSGASGFIWKPGLVVTADEALAEEGETTVTLPGGEAVAALLAGRDPTTDVALLRVDRPDLTPAPLAASPVGVGALALVIGAQEGAPTAALGVVARAGGPWRSVRGGEIDARIELDLRLRRSAEGGLVLDAAGRAIGMAVFGPRQRVLVIPAATVERVAARLEGHGCIPRGYLGLGLQPVAVEGGEGRGAMVMSVDPQGPGAAAGIHQGDVILTLDGQPVRGVSSLRRSLGPDSVGRTVKVGLRRAGGPVEVSLTIAERP